jgi:hypothetical protein
LTSRYEILNVGLELRFAELLGKRRGRGRPPMKASDAEGGRHEGPPMKASDAEGGRHEGPPMKASDAEGGRHEGPPRKASASPAIPPTAPDMSGFDPDQAAEGDDAAEPAPAPEPAPGEADTAP